MGDFYQGDDIPIQIELEENDNLLNLEDLDDIFVYFYTDGAIVYKYSKFERAGYGMIHKNTPTEYACLLDSDKTKLLTPGKLWIEVNVVSRDPKNLGSTQVNRIAKSCIAFLEKSIIKSESK